MATYNEYEDKEALIENPSIPDINKVKANDMNYIKYNLPHISNEVDEDYRVNLLYSKNLLDYKEYTISNTLNGTFTITNDILNFNNNSGREFYVSFGKIKVKPNTKYTLNGFPNDTSNNNCIYIMQQYDSSGSIVKTTYPYALRSTTFTTESTTAYIILRLTTQSMNTQGNYSLSAILVEGETSTTFEPYITPSIYVDNEEIYSKPVVLWQNSSPTSDFANQTITLSDAIENYSYYEVIYKESKSSQTYKSCKLPVGLNMRMEVDIGFMFIRIVNSMSGTSMGITECVYYATYGSATTTQANNAVIPYQIIGYK